MPRDGSSVYTLPFPDVVADTTIESPVYNGFTNDVAQDLNAPRPIVAGGTGATSAADALTNLGAEMALQVVTNYDSFVFKPGSFYAAAGATGAPTANASAGICIVTNATNDLLLEVRETSGRRFARAKASGVWGSWSERIGSIATADAAYVNVSGDTMTGPLTISNTAPIIEMNETDTGNKWLMVVDSSSISWRYNTTATNIFNVSSSGANLTGTFNATGAISTAGSVCAGNGGASGIYFFGNSGAKHLQYDGSNFNFAGGAVNTPGLYNYSIQATLTSVGSGIALNIQNTTSGSNKYFRTTTSATLEFINSANTLVIASLSDAGALYLLSGASFGGSITRGWMSLGENALELGSQSTPGSAIIDFHTDGTTADYNARIIQSGGGNLQVQNAILEAQIGVWAVGYRCRAGISAGGYTGNNFNINHGTGQQLWIDNSNIGTIAYTSDYRTKKDVAELPRTWDVVKTLRPIRYTHKDFTPPSEQEACAKSGEPFMKGDDVEQWGFIAHELQETLTESASSGVKDSPNTIQSPNPWTVIAALTKALQEAMARIEALEKR